MKQNNRGMSMVEIIVVVAILAIMVGCFMLMPGAIAKQKVAEAAERLSYQMSNARTEAMCRQNVVMTITKKSDGIYTQITGGEEVCISDEEIQIFYSRQKNDIEQGEVELTIGSTIEIRYDRDTGGIQPETDGSGEDHYLSKIVCKKGSIEKTIHCVAKTGKHTVE